MAGGSPPPLVLFGAFDRHNLGDLLLGHVAARLCAPRTTIAAGLRRCDLGASGGHAVVPISSLDEAVDVLHVGGELLCCEAYQAAVMLESPAAAARIVARLDRDREAATAWARQRIGTVRHLPYLFPTGDRGRRLYAGIGGTTLDRLPAAARGEAIDAMRAADGLWVRDARTQGHLAAAGVTAPLAPDPAVLVAALFGHRIGRRLGALSALRHRFANGYLALQLSADCGDDATLDVLAAQIARASARHGLGVVMFCAGRAPWHDDVEPYHRLLRRIPGDGMVHDAHDMWTLCALVAASCATVATSLHARIVAEAFARPALSLTCGAAGAAKLEAYFGTWAREPTRWLVPPDQLADALPAALAVPGRQRAAYAAAQAAAARAAWRMLLERLRQARA